MKILPLLLFVAVPLLELAILIKVGEIVGVGATIVLVISTAVIGVSLLKRQGLAALARARGHLHARGRSDVTLVITGGLRTHTDFAKALRRRNGWMPGSSTSRTRAPRSPAICWPRIGRKPFSMPAPPPAARRLSSSTE